MGSFALLTLAASLVAALGTGCGKGHGNGGTGGTAGTGGTRDCASAGIQIGSVCTDAANEGEDCTDGECCEGLRCVRGGDEWSACRRTCSVDADCAEGACSDGLCPLPRCANHVKDCGETDVDCGGPSSVMWPEPGQCRKCRVAQACAQDDDCRGDPTAAPPIPGVCIGGACYMGYCADGVKTERDLDRSIDGETDVDCGRMDCPKCQSGAHCAWGYDCVSGVCVGATCQGGFQAGASCQHDFDCEGEPCVGVCQ